MKNQLPSLLLLGVILALPSYAAPVCEDLLQKRAIRSDVETLDYLHARYGVTANEVQFTPHDHYPIIVRGVDEAALVPRNANLETVADEKLHDVIVVGGGPAGLTSTLYLTDQGHDVLVIDPNERLGGLAQGSTLNDVRVGTGAAYSAGPDDMEEYRIFQHIGLGNYKKALSISEPIDSLFTGDEVFKGIWEKETLEKLPADFAVFKRVLRHMVQDQSIYDVSTEAGKWLDNNTAKKMIQDMPDALSKLRDPESKAIYKRFLSDTRLDRSNPMSHVINLMNRYGRSALGGTTDKISGYALVDFYEKEMMTRYTGTYGTGEIVGRILDKLGDSGRQVTSETRASVSKIVNLEDGTVEVHYIKEGKEIIAKAKAVVFSAPIKLAPKVIDGFAEIAPEAKRVIESMEITNYAVHVARTKGHPLRETYDLWMATTNDSKYEPTDVISSRWQDPDINGFSGMRGFEKNPADDRGAITIYQPLGPAGTGFGSKEAISEAERSVDWIKSQLNPYLKKKFNTEIDVELIETNRWPLSIHIARPGWMQDSQVLGKPVGHVYFANNNMGLPEFEKAMKWGKRAAESINRLLGRAPASVAIKFAPELRKDLTQKVQACDVKHPSKYVYFFKQWHLPPGRDTHTEIERSFETPQHDNQLAIFIQLDKWIREKQKMAIFAEGCAYPSEINSRTQDNFNGWTVADLSKKADDSNFADIMTNIGYKIKARWKNNTRVVCGDDSEAMRTGLRSFSDARGILGYLSRLEQFRKTPEKATGYLGDVVNLFHMPKETNVEQAIARLNLELRKTVDSIERSIEVRNEKLVNAIVEDESKLVAVVFGGAHAPGVLKLLEKKEIGCSIVEPWGYQDDEVEMLDHLKHLIDARIKAQA